VSLLPRYNRRNPLAIGKLWLIDLYYALYASLWKHKGLLPKELTHILLVNPAHLGDVVISTAILREIKQSFPDCRVDVLVGDWATPLVKEHPGVCRVYCLNPLASDRSNASHQAKRKKYQDQKREVLPELKANSYDAIFFLNSYDPSLISLFKQFTCPLIGFDTSGGGPLLSRACGNPKGMHEVQYQATLLTPWLGEPKLSHQYQAWLKSFESTNVSAQSLRRNFDQMQPYVIIHSGSGNPAKEWPLENWQTTIEALDQYHVNIVLTGQGARETRQSLQLMQAMPKAKIINLVNQLSFDEYCFLVANSTAILCVDSLAGHIAGAYNKPTVVVTNGLSLISRWHPLGERITLLENSVPCSPCHSNPCAQRACITGVSSQTLIQVLPKLLPQKVVLQ